MRQLFVIRFVDLHLSHLVCIALFGNDTSSEAQQPANSKLLYFPQLALHTMAIRDARAKCLCNWIDDSLPRKEALQTL
uniref:Putative secreted protein n=1 Tax=Anopheles darlingi TaxID=43151 RepID=A0A2M4DES3_ANODA